MPHFDETPAGLIALLTGVDLYKQVRWQSYEEDDRREPTDNLTEAVCASSRLRSQPDMSHVLQIDRDNAEQHYLMIDLDVQSYLVPSTTPGHSHLYVERSVPWRDLARLIEALAACGIIEHGYAAASLQRRSTTLRLPWIKKEPEPAEDGTPMKVKFMKIDGRGNWMPRATEVRTTRQRFDAYQFINAHPDMSLTAADTSAIGHGHPVQITPGPWMAINHNSRGAYLVREGLDAVTIEALLDRFSIVEYLTWVNSVDGSRLAEATITPPPIAGGNDAP